MTRVLICDDQQVVREGLRAILGTAPQMTVVGLAGDGRQAVELVATTSPDVVLMDLKMPAVDGVQATRQIRERFPNVHVLVLTTYDADDWVFAAIRAGAAGYLLKDSPRETLISAIEITATGRTYVDPSVAGRLFAQVAQGLPEPPDPKLTSLTERERQVLGLLGRGLSNADIAVELHMAEGTVRNHVSAILGKLDLSDRTQAALAALRFGLGAPERR